MVAGASVAFTAPFWSATSARLIIPGVDSIPTSPDGGPYVNAVTPDFFATMGTRIVRGRGFDDGDGRNAPPVVVVTQTFARVVWPGGDPLGQCMKIGADTMPCATVVGVAADAKRQSLTSDAPVMQYYIPLDQERVSPNLRTLLVRTRGDPRMANLAIRRAVQAALPDAPYPTVMYLSALIAPELRPWRLGATLFGIFGLVALVLAALGLYSVVAYTVAQRTHEMGVRVALGGTGAHLVRLVLGSTLRVVGLGLVIGIALSLSAGRWVEPLLFRVSPHDPLVLVLVTGTLLVVGLVASLAPARRARRVSPMEVLRAE
jgi:predicted permease